MATSESVSQLYLNACSLAYKETQLAISPRLPFEIVDRIQLSGQAERAADSAKALRSKSAGALDQNEVDHAISQSDIALTMLNVINDQISNEYTKDGLYWQIEAAVTAIDNC